MGRTNGINDKTGKPYWKERQENSHEKVRAQRRRHILKTKYGLTEALLEDILKAQDGKCAICSTELVEEETRYNSRGHELSNIRVDHNHQTGKVRGLLCPQCNLGLGHFRDNPFLVQRAYSYIHDSEGPTKASDIVGDVNSSIKNYKKIKITKDSLLLSGDGFFKTLQGEGPTLGKPCVFVRLHHCNLHCEFCDAYYTWMRRSREFWLEAQRLSFKEAKDKISETWNSSRFGRVVWTGGEPLIFKSQIDQVVSLLGPKWTHEIETNGTLMPTKVQLETFQFNCSPKLSNNKTDRIELRIRPKILQALDQVNTTFKFVCRDIHDLEEIERDYVPFISEDKIIIMGEGVTNDKITYHIQNLYEPVLKRGWRMTPRFQAIFADGARRGV